MKLLNRLKQRFSLALALILVVFAVLTLSMIVGGTIFWTLQRSGLIEPFEAARGNFQFGFILVFALCAIVGIVLTAFLSKKLLAPIREVISATHNVASGNFDTRIDIKGVGELEELSTSFNKMAIELSNTESLRNDFVNNIPHEFKTPIASIKGYAKQLKNTDLDEVTREEYLDIIISESSRLSELSTNILRLAKYENTEIVPLKTSFRIDEQIRKTLIPLESKWAEKQIEVEIDLDEIIFEGDAELLSQVWYNIVDNAIKFTPAQGLITITLKKHDEGICFSVADSGVGMDESTRDHVFEKFYQADSSHSQSGNGLGLSIVKRIVDLHEGSIKVESSPGEGTLFVLEL